jgi:hypothetical protein
VRGEGGEMGAGGSGAARLMRGGRRWQRQWQRRRARPTALPAPAAGGPRRWGGAVRGGAVTGQGRPPPTATLYCRSSTSSLSVSRRRSTASAPCEPHRHRRRQSSGSTARLANVSEELSSRRQVVALAATRGEGRGVPGGA